MKIYIVMEQMIDDISIVSVHISEQKAKFKADRLEMNKKAEYYHYYVEDYEVEVW